MVPTARWERMKRAMSVPATMTRPAIARFGAVDSVLLGHGTTPRQLDDKDAVERSLCWDDNLRSFSTLAAQTSRRSSAPLVTWCNGHDRPRRPVLVQNDIHILTSGPSSPPKSTTCPRKLFMAVLNHLLSICLPAYVAYAAYVENGVPMQLWSKLEIVFQIVLSENMASPRIQNFTTSSFLAILALLQSNPCGQTIQ